MKKNNLTEVPEYLKNITVLAPAEKETGFGDSLTGSLIFYDHGIDSDLFWLNGRLNTTMPDILYRTTLKF